jgi:hypothetical protein
VGGSLRLIVAGGGDAVFGINDQNKAFRRAGNGWTQVLNGDNSNGTLSSITAAGSDAWGLDGTTIYSVGGSFARVAGSLTSIAGGRAIGGGELWGINSGGTPFRWDGQGWQPMGGILSSIAVGGSSVWGINSDGAPFRWDGGHWQPAGGKLTQISVDSGNGRHEAEAWGINSDGAPFRWDGGHWQPVGGKLTQIAAAAGIGDHESEVWGINSDGAPFRWDGGHWQPVAGKLTQISVAKSNIVFGDKGNAVWGLG